MLYIVRMTSGDCVVVMAEDERGAGQIALQLRMDQNAEVAAIRQLDRFAVQLSPREDGSFEISHWDGETFAGILANEYPLLNEAYKRANAQPLMPERSPETSALSQLGAGYEKNNEIIRDGVRRELGKGKVTEITTKPKAIATRR